jgi:hypothetical protein
VVFLDGAYHEQGSQLAWQPLQHLQTREVGQVLQRLVHRIDKHLRVNDTNQVVLWEKRTMRVARILGRTCKAAIVVFAKEIDERVAGLSIIDAI